MIDVSPTLSGLQNLMPGSRGSPQRVSLAGLNTTRAERRLAAGVGLVSLLVFAAAVPFATVPLARFDAFIPIYQSVLIVNELITAFLLFGQFAFSRSRPLLALAAGYLFAGVMAAVHMMSFPGLFAAGGLLGAGPQSTAWLYMFWHGGFPLAAIAYTLIGESRGDRARLSSGIAIPILAAVGLVAASAGGLTLLATAGAGMLPPIMQGNSYTPAMIVVVSSVWSFSLLALILLWSRRHRSVLDLWLAVVMGAWLCDIALSAVLNAGRFDLGFYAGRIYGLLASAFVLCVLLYETIGLYGIACGVIDQRTAELGRANAKLEAIIDSSPLAIVGLDRSGRVTTWGRGAENTFGYTKAEVLLNPYPLVPEGAENEFDELFHRVIDRGEVIAGMAVQRRRRDGKLLDIVFAGAPLYDEQQRIVGAVYALEDVTERKKVERGLIQAQKMEAVGQLTGGLAHDFNNLLGVVIGNLDLIQEELPPDHPVQEMIKTALEASLRGSQLNRSLLAFSRKQELRPERIEVATVVNDMAKMLRRLIGERIELEAVTAPDVWPVVVDVSQLESAILNLAVNARDAMPDGGRLMIEASNTSLDEAYAADNAEVLAGEYALIAISDTGSGMTPEILAKVFEPFFTTKEVGKGTGLGLSMVHGFIKQSRGHVKIYSEVGRGTTIRLYLPRSRDGSDETEVAPEATVELPRGGSETILVVEDNEPLRRTAVAKIVRLGYRVIEASTAAEALTLIDAGEPVDLLFTDIVMPGKLDGIGLAHEARQRRPDIKVLLTSGFTERWASSSQSGLPWPLLSKPYRIADLGRMMREALGSSS